MIGNKLFLSSVFFTDFEFDLADDRPFGSRVNFQFDETSGSRLNSDRDEAVIRVHVVGNVEFLGPARVLTTVAREEDLDAGKNLKQKQDIREREEKSTIILYFYDFNGYLDQREAKIHFLL